MENCIIKLGDNELHVEGYYTEATQGDNEVSGTAARFEIERILWLKVNIHGIMNGFIDVTELLNECEDTYLDIENKCLKELG